MDEEYVMPVEDHRIFAAEEGVRLVTDGHDARVGAVEQVVLGGKQVTCQGAPLASFGLLLEQFIALNTFVAICLALHRERPERHRWTAGQAEGHIEVVLPDPGVRAVCCSEFVTVTLWMGLASFVIVTEDGE